MIESGFAHSISTGAAVESLRSESVRALSAVRGTLGRTGLGPVTCALALVETSSAISSASFLTRSPRGDAARGAGNRAAGALPFSAVQQEALPAHASSGRV